jgi:hypothetical protein
VDGGQSARAREPDLQEVDADVAVGLADAVGAVLGLFRSSVKGWVWALGWRRV